MKQRDEHIYRVFDRIKKTFAAKKKAHSSSRLPEEDRAAYVMSLQATTVNLAPEDFQSKVMEMSLPNHMRRMSLNSHSGSDKIQKVKRQKFLAESQRTGYNA